MDDTHRNANIIQNNLRIDHFCYPTLEKVDKVIYKPSLNRYDYQTSLECNFGKVTEFGV